MTSLVIVSAARTPVGKFGGSLSSISAVDLGAKVIAEAMARAGLRASDIDEVIMGNVLQAGLGQNPTRQALLKGGCSVYTPATTLNMVCGSGLQSIIYGGQSILSGSANVVVTGGMENMSSAAYVLNGARWGYRMGDQKVIDTAVNDGLFCAINHYHMGTTAENVAKKYKISRQEQDEFAWLSQRRADTAQNSGAFDHEIVPITLKNKKGDILFSKDEHLRPDTTLEGLSKLKPAFMPDGTVTAGNSSGINDGAAALIVTTESHAKALGLKPMAKIRGYATVGVDPAYMGMGPVPATKLALERAGLTIDDIDLIEANEAFAAQFAAVGKELGLDIEKTNLNGGAIALGHPIGASGSRILVTLLYALKSRNKSLGLATLCVGGGQGVAVVVERMN